MSEEATCEHGTPLSSLCDSCRQYLSSDEGKAELAAFAVSRGWLPQWMVEERRFTDSIVNAIGDISVAEAQQAIETWRHQHSSCNAVETTALHPCPVPIDDPLRESGVAAADMFYRGSSTARAGFNHGVAWTIGQLWHSRELTGNIVERARAAGNVRREQPESGQKASAHETQPNAADRLFEALRKIAAYDPGQFRPLEDEIAIWKLATDAMREYRDPLISQQGMAAGAPGAESTAVPSTFAEKASAHCYRHGVTYDNIEMGCPRCSAENGRSPHAP